MGMEKQLMKDAIPILRLPTNGSREGERIEER